MVMLVILFFGHLALYWFLISVFPAAGHHLLAVQVAVGLLWISFIAATLIAQKFNTIATRTFYKVAAVWIGFFLYLLLGACVYAIIIALFPATPQRTISLIGETLIGIATVISMYGIINAASDRNEVRGGQDPVQIVTFVPDRVYWFDRPAIDLP